MLDCVQNLLIVLRRSHILVDRVTYNPSSQLSLPCLTHVRLAPAKKLAIGMKGLSFLGAFTSSGIDARNTNLLQHAVPSLICRGGLELLHTSG